MSMYKTIFVTEETDLQSGEQVFTINGEVSLYGESAFSSLDEAVSKIAGVDANAVVVKVASGKYDSYVVINDHAAGSVTAVSEVVAVDFNGTAMPTADGEVVINETGLAADAQGAVIGYLNNTGLSEGKLFVSAADAPAGSNTLYVGAADTVGYVAGSNGNTLLNINGEFMNSLSDSATTLANESEIYVSADYNASTEGWGTTRFANYASAYGYATANAKKATIIVEKTTTLSGNTFDDNHENYTNMAVVVNDGATVGNALSKWDMTYKVTVKAGGTLDMARHKNASVSNVHLKSALVIGEAGEGKKTAYLKFLSDSHQDGDISIRSNGSLTADNAEITVQDLDAQGKMTLTDTKLTVDGALATATFFATTLTRTDVTVGGTQISGGLSDFSGGATNQLGNVKMVDSSITFGAGSTVSVKANVSMTGKSVLTAGTLDIASGKKITLDSSSTIFAEALNIAGTGKIVVNILDGFAGGKIIDITGANGLTEDILSKITVSGSDVFASYIDDDGDLALRQIVAPEITENENEVIIDMSQSNAEAVGTKGSSTKDTVITTQDAADITEEAVISGEIIGKNVTVDNSKKLAVSGSIKAEDKIVITNKGNNTGDNEAVLNGGLNDAGEEEKAIVEAKNTIAMQNDGHAVVDFKAKDIVIANNSVNTLKGTIGTAETESIVIGTGSISVDGTGVTLDPDENGTLDGSIKDAILTATNISIADQTVADSTFNGNMVVADSSLTDATVNGTMQLKGDATIAGTSNVGRIDVGYKEYVDSAATLNILGNLTSSAQIIVGNEYGDPAAKLNIGSLDASRTVANVASALNIRENAVASIANADVSTHQFRLRGDATAVNSTIYGAWDSHGVAGEEHTATFTLDNSTFSTDVEVNKHFGFNIGTADSAASTTAAEGSGKVVLKNSAALNVGHLNMHSAGADMTVALEATDSTVSVLNNMYVGTGASVELTSSTLTAGTVTNNGTVTVSGDSTLNIGTLTTTKEKSTYLQVLDGTKLTNSNVGGAVNLQGDLEVVTGLTVNELRGGYVVDSPIKSEIKGDKVTVNTFGNLKNGEYTISADMEFGQHLYLGQDGGSATVSSALSAGKGGASSAYFIYGDVTLENGASMTSADGEIQLFDGAAVTVNAGAEVDVTGIFTTEGESGVLNINGGSVNVINSIRSNGNGGLTISVTDGTLVAEYITEKINDGEPGNQISTPVQNISFTITAEKLASVGAEYVLLEQTVTNWYASSVESYTVSVAGTDRQVGDSWEIGDVTYSLTNGDGNDIILKAKADTLTVDADITPNGFNKFNSFVDAFAAAAKSSEDITINLTSDINETWGNQWWSVDNNITVDAAEKTAVTIKPYSYAGLDSVNNAGEVTFGKNVDLTVDGTFYAGSMPSDPTLTLNVNGSLHVTGSANFGEKRKAADENTDYLTVVNFGAGSSFTIGKEDSNGNVDFIMRGEKGAQVNFNGTEDARVTFSTTADNRLYAGELNASYADITATGAFDLGRAEANDYGNNMAMNITNSTLKAGHIGLYSGGKFSATDSTVNVGSVSNSGEFYVTDSTFKADKVENSNTFHIDGENTIQINNYTGKGIWAKDGVVLNDSYIKSPANSSLRMLGDLTVNGGLEVAYLWGAHSSQGGGVGGEFNIADDSTVNVSYGVEFTNNYTLNGGKIVLSGGRTDGNESSPYHKLWGVVFQHGTYDINTDIDVQGIVNDVSQYGSVHFTYADATLRSSLAQYDTKGEPIWINSSNVTVTENGSIFSTVGLYVHKSEEGAAASTLTVNNGKVEVGTLKVYEESSASFENASLTAGTVNIEAGSSLSVTGDSTIKVDKFTSTSDKAVTFGGAEDRSTLSLGSVSGNGASIDASRLNIYKADVTLTDDVSVGAPTNILHKIQDSTIDMGGNTLSYKGFTVLDSYSGKSYLGSNEGVTLKSGEFKVTDSAHLCFQGYDHVIAEDAVVTFDGTNINSSMVNVYGSLTINGKVNVTHGNFGYDNVGTTDAGWGKASYPESVLTVSGENAAYTIENGHMFRVAYETDATAAGTMIVENGASFSFTGSRAGTGLFYNANKVYVDADSSFTVGSYYGYGSDGANDKKGAFNSETAGEMIVLGNVTVDNALVTDSLVISAGAALSAGSITVDNLTLEIGGSLTLTGTDSEVGTFTVTGALNPENAEFTLVTSGWNSDFAKSISFGGVTYTWDEAGKYLDGTDLDQGEFYFTVEDGKLYVAKQTEEIGGIYIGDVSNAVDNKITVDGVTYTVGKDAFADADAAAGTMGTTEKAAVTTITIDEDYSTDTDKVSVLLDEDHFKNVNTIRVSKDGKVVDISGAVETAGSLTLENDGHFEANLQVNGDFTFTNTSDQTLTGEISAEYIDGINTGTITGQTFTAENGIVIDNTNGNIENSTLNSTSIDITGGDASNVTVNTADPLNLTDTNSFGLNAVDSDVYRVNLIGSANLSVDGDNNSIDTEISADTDHSGTLTLNGNQTYGEFADLSAHKIVIAANKNVTINGLADSKELEIAGTLNTAFDDMSNFTNAGYVTGTGTLNTTHDGDWVVNDSVTRDFSGFTGTVEMGKNNASIVLGKGDIVNGAAAKESYFSDNATVTVKDTQSVVLAGDGVNTGIDFKGDGVLKVGDYDNGFAEDSDGFTQTLTGNNADFSGTVNVSEGAELTIASALGASAINLDYNDNTDATGTTDDTKLILNKEGLELGSVITGDANDVIDVKENATLTSDAALDNFAGTVNIADSKALTITNKNTTAAIFAGSTTATVNVNNGTEVTFTGDNKDYKGALNVDSSWLKLKNNWGAEGSSINFTFNNGNNGYAAVLGSNTVTIGAVLKSESSSAIFKVLNGGDGTILSADGALNQYKGELTIGSKLTLSGDNNTYATFHSASSGDTTSSINLGGNLTVNAAGALDGYEGSINIAGNKLTINGDTESYSKFTGTAAAEIVINADTEMVGNAKSLMYATGIDAISGFAGTITVDDGKKLTIDSTNTTSAKFVSDAGTVVFAGNDSKTTNTLSREGALNDVKGTIQVDSKATLNLTDENTISATVTRSGVIDADANQVFTGDVTGFTGKFDIAAGKEVQLTGTFSDAQNKVVNAYGGTLTLADKDVEVQVNAGTNTLNTLNFGDNTLTLGTGFFDNVNGTGSVVKFGDDKEFVSITAGDINVKDSDNLTISKTLQATVNLTIDAQGADTTTDIDYDGTALWDDKLNVSITNEADFAGTYKLVDSASGFAAAFAGITLTVAGDTAALDINQSVKLGGYSWQLRNNGGVLELTKRSEYSNFVVVNGAWGTHKYDSVNDNGTDRVIGYDAAQSLDLAAEYIKGRPDGMDWGTNNGDAKIELTAGKYSLTNGKHLMTTGTDGNGVTKMTVAARDGEAASLRGDIYASENAGNTLTLENVQLIGNLFGNGNVVIANSDAATSSGRVIAGGVDKGIIEKASSVTLKGGVFNTSYIVGGSFTAEENASITVSGNTSVTINNTDATKALIVSGSIYGGSFAYGINSTITQTGNASVTINATNAVTIRGNIYISGDERNGNLTMDGDGKLTFSGKAENLTFTGTAYGLEGVDDTIVFDDFSGKFNGSIREVETITISGDTNLELGRRQTKTAETDLKFVVDDTTVTSDGAMYIVRDKNRWEFAESITIDASAAVTGTYLLVDNYAAGFDGFAIAIGDVTCSVNQSIVTSSAKYTLNYKNNKLTLKVDTSAGYTGNKINTTEDLQLVVDANTSLEGGITARSTAEVAVKIAENATVEIGKTASGASEGIMLYNGSSASIEVAENADLTIYGNITSVNRSESGDNSLVIGKNAEVTINGVNSAETVVMGGGDDEIIIGDGAQVTITNGGTNLNMARVQFYGGADTLQLGAGSSLKVVDTVNEKNSGIIGSGAASSDVLKMEKGSSIEAGKVTGFNIEMDVDSVLAMSNTSGNTNGNINVVGITELVLAPSTEAVAGAKGIFSNFLYEQYPENNSLKVDHVDMDFGVAQQIAGNTTPEDDTDNVWAALSKVDGDLVVAWGRTENEVTKALEAFGNDSSLIYGGANFGKSLVADAASLSDGADVADFDDKKNNGQLA